MKKKCYIAVDVEADAKSPAGGSMVCFGAVVVADMSQTFYGKTRPIKESWNQKSLDVSGFTRAEHLQFDEPKEVMQKFAEWVDAVSGDRQPVLLSDNPAYDWQWINYYFDGYLGENPFGHSARRVGDLYAGIMRDMSRDGTWRRYVKTPHDHTPVNDAKGVAEIVYVMRTMGLEIE